LSVPSSHEFVPVVRDGAKTVIASQDLQDSCLASSIATLLNRPTICRLTLNRKHYSQDIFKQIFMHIYRG